MKGNTYYSISQTLPYHSSTAIPSTSAIQSMANLYSPLSSRATYVRERPSSYEVKPKKQDLERYQSSFSKRKIIHIWKGHRSLIKVASQLPKPLEPIVYQTVYQEMKPFLTLAYMEDFTLPLIPLSLFSWLQSMKLTAQAVGKDEEVGYWEEMKQFFHHCMQHQLLADLISSHF